MALGLDLVRPGFLLARRGLHPWKGQQEALPLLHHLRNMADGAGVAFWKLRPGNKAVVYYDDDDVWHERRLLLPGGSPESYWVRTSDADLYEEDLQGGSTEGPRRVRHVPFGVKTLPNMRVAVYRFKEDLTDDDLRKWIKEAIQEHARSYGREPDLSGPWRQFKMFSVCVARHGD